MSPAGASSDVLGKDFEPGD